MEKNLPVPYKSQHDGDSKVSNNDCGPASLAMVMEFLGKPHSVGGVLKKLGNPTGFTTISQLAKVAQDQGFNVESKIDATFAELKKYIDKGLPVIVVGGYGYLNSTQDKNFKASHIMVVVGYREDDSVYVNDPNFWGQFRQDGDHHVYTGPEFFTFWRNEGNKEGNQPNILFVLSKKDEENPQETTLPIKKVRITADIGARLRASPAINKQNILRVVSRGVELEVISSVTGDTVNGNPLWFQVKDGPKTPYVWSGAVTVLEDEVKEGAANVAAPTSDEYLKGIQAIYQMTKEILEANNALPVDPKPQVNKPNLWQQFKNILRRG